jgi:hypothetical protein
MRWLALLLVVGCSKGAAPAPVASTSAAPPAAPQTLTVSSVVFVGDELSTCDEITRNADDWKNLDEIRRQVAADARTNVKEVLHEDRTCEQALKGARVEQARCDYPNGNARRYYDRRDVQASDVEMKKCMTAGGTWRVNDSRDALKQHYEREAARLR